MKNYQYFALCLIAFIFGSCSWGVQTRTVGTYVPHALNVLGSQTTVVLSQANYRVLRNVEVVVEINNTNLRKTDVEKSAFAALTRKYPLSGSQAYINLVTEEVCRDEVAATNPSILYDKKQYIAIRATIIEFLKDGESVQYAAPEYQEPINIVNEDSIKYGIQMEEENVLQLLAQKKVNKYYVAYLYKSRTLNDDKSVQKLFDWKEIDKLVKDWTVKDLKKNSEGHDVEFEKFALETN